MKPGMKQDPYAATKFVEFVECQKRYGAQAPETLQALHTYRKLTGKVLPPGYTY